MILSYVHQIDNIILMKKVIVDKGRRDKFVQRPTLTSVFIHSKTNIIKLFLGFIFIYSIWLDKIKRKQVIF